VDKKNKMPQELAEAYRHCLEIARHHYENFPVASFLLPSRLRKHIAAIYAFARIADDFADIERERIKLLHWRSQLQVCLQQTPSHPIFLALSHTIREFNLPITWLDDLLTAFLMDLDINRFQTLDELHRYCRYSANPVGRIVLWIFGYQAEQLMEMSDYITSALQLTNFWQDISIDLKKDKIYIPVTFLKKYYINESDILNQNFTTNLSAMMIPLIEHTAELYRKGEGLVGEVNGRLRWELRFTMAGGKAILNKVYENRDKLLTFRPVLHSTDWIKITTGILLRMRLS
jgi:squalene synthase HpnC